MSDTEEIEIRGVGTSLPIHGSMPGGSTGLALDQLQQTTSARAKSLQWRIESIERQLAVHCYDRSELLGEREGLKADLSRYTQAYEAMDEAGIISQTLEEQYTGLRHSCINLQIAIQNELKTLPSDVTLAVPKGEGVGRSSLQKAHIPIFDGTWESWPLFWQRVEATIADAPGSSDHDKIMFLHRHCHAEIQAMIDSRQGMGGSFDSIVKALKERFDDPEELMENLILKFLNLKAVPYHQQRIVELRTNYEGTIGVALQHRNQSELFEYLVKTILLHKILPPEFSAQLNQTLRKKHFSLGEVRTEMDNSIKFIAGPIAEKEKSKNKPQSNNYSSNNSKVSWSDKDKGRFTIAQNRTYRVCLFCEATDHETCACVKYNTVQKRRTQLENLKRCANCANRAHATSKCDRVEKLKCALCNGKHHTVLCVKKLASSDSSNQKTVRLCTMAEAIALRSVALPTATGKVIGPEGNSTTRVFFDLGAQTSIITRTLAQQLRVQCSESAHMAISGLFVSKQAKRYGLAKFHLELGDMRKEIVAVVMDMPAFTINIPGLLDAIKVIEGHGLQLADREINSNQLSGVHLSLGGDYFHEIVDKHDKVEGINVCRTPAGWMLSGAIQDPSVDGYKFSKFEDVGLYTLTLEVSGKPFDSHAVVGDAEVDMDPGVYLPVHKLWDLDVIGINSLEISPTDVAAHSYFLNTVRYENDQYWVRLPWKPDAPSLPSHFGLAMGRLRSQKRWLERQELVGTYHQLILDMLQADFIEKAPNCKPHESVHYLPHSSVAKDSVTTPIRIVFDASARIGKGPSLNDCLLTGPTLTGHIVETILRFRTGLYAYSADISKAFLRIGLQMQDRDYTRFLWIRDPSSPKLEVEAYRFKSVLFGACCSPFLLQATIDYHLSQTDDPLAEVIRRSFYVDNLQGGSDEGKVLCDLYESANRLLQQANMPLRMWVTNNSDLIERIRKYDPDYISPEITTLLGLQWDVAGDQLGFKLPVWIAGPLTKRTLLSRLHAVFDPLGLLSPLTIRGKLILRDAWATKLGWNEPLPEVFIQQWVKLAADLERVNEVWVPRSVCTDEGFENFHVFCDASSKAYGAACYGVSVLGARLVMAKSKPAPSKRTLPELEILAVEVGVKLVKFVEKSFGKSIPSVYVWTDSEVALQWIRNDKSSKVFVQNRVKTIRDGADHYNFMHVSSKSNPADKLTRGITGREFFGNDLWFNGPTWINDASQWPTQKPQVISVHVALVEEVPLAPLIEVERFSSLQKVLATTRFILQGVANWLNVLSRPLQTDWSSQDALGLLIKWDQQQAYPQEWEYLSSGKGKPPLLVQQLGLYVGEEGLLRCRGRIQATDADIDPEPILLVKKSHLTKLIIAQYHEISAHGGVNQTLANLKAKYCIPQARVVIKQVLHNCRTCRVFSAKPYKYPGPPSLPRERVSFQSPFQTIGIDYTGSITLAVTGKGDSKLYICLFTCTATRAVHLEIVHDLSATTFLLALRQFIGRRGCPGTIITDNATCFRATADFFKNLKNSVELQEFLLSREINWNFIPPRSPWFGGFYERLIGLLKHSLRRVLFRKALSIEELRTALCEIEQHINNRPLTYVSDSVDDPIPISPAHLIYGRRLEPFPLPVDEETFLLDPSHQNLQESYQRVNQLLEHWTKVWGKDYLTSLREKHYGANAATQPEPPREGDIVLVSGPGSRSHWPLGRVMQLIPDQEGIIRLVKVLVNGKLMPKTINKLVPLELAASAVENNESDEEDVSETSPLLPSSLEMGEDEGSGTLEPSGPTEGDQPPSSERSRPRRHAAIEAEAHRRNLIQSSQL